MSRLVFPVSKSRWEIYAYRLFYGLVAIILVLLSGCRKKPIPVSESSPDKSYQSQTTAQPQAASTPGSTPLNFAALHVDGTIALHRARTICNLGSRAYATPGYRQTLAYLRSELTRLGWNTVFQAFDAPTPLGPRTYTNLIATWPIEKGAPIPKNRLILSAHYDSPGSALTTFPAASSSSAGCGILLEIAERLKNFPALASRLTLVFFDGEEPTQQISATDGLSGSRFFLHTLQENGQIPQIRALVAFGAIGHRGAHWTLPTLTDSNLNQALQAFSDSQKWENQIIPLGRPSWGPHLPALQAGIPALYLHDALYPALGTADDTSDQLNAESLRRATLASLQFLTLPPVHNTN